MKKILFSCIIYLPALALHAQQGAITYERKVNMHRRVQDEQMKAMMPEFRTTKHVLMFAENVSVYKAVKEEDAPDPFDNAGGGGGGARVMIRMGPGENGMLYKNYASGQIQEQTEFAEKTYIIDDTIKVQPWKLTEESKTILGHACKKAVMKTQSGNDVSAWYAEDIHSPAGPENYSGLPGTVLGIDVNNGEIIFTATDIKPAVDKKELTEPKTGKHITRVEFQKKMEEVLGPPGPGGRRIMRF